MQCILIWWMIISGARHQHLCNTSLLLALGHIGLGPESFYHHHHHQMRWLQRSSMGPSETLELLAAAYQSLLPCQRCTRFPMYNTDATKTKNCKEAQCMCEKAGACVTQHGHERAPRWVVRRSCLQLLQSGSKFSLGFSIIFIKAQLVQRKWGEDPLGSTPSADSKLWARLWRHSLSWQADELLMPSQFKVERDLLTSSDTQKYNESFWQAALTK